MNNEEKLVSNILETLIDVDGFVDWFGQLDIETKLSLIKDINNKVELYKLRGNLDILFDI